MTQAPSAPPTPPSPSNSDTPSVTPSLANLWTDVALTAGPPTMFPNCGGVCEVKENGRTEMVPFSGTYPGTNLFSFDVATQAWHCPTPMFTVGYLNHQGPRSIQQYRPTGIKSKSKVQTFCSTFSGVKFVGLEPKEGETITKVSVYKDACKLHMLECGMLDVFLLPDPLTPTIKYNLFDKTSRFTLEAVQRHIVLFNLQADYWQKENLQWSGKFLLASLSPSLLASVLAEIGLNASGPEVLSATMSLLYKGASSEILETATNKIYNIKLSNYPGENVELMNEDLKTLLDFLDSAEWVKPGDAILRKIARKYADSSDFHFRQWASGYYREVDWFVSACLSTDAAVVGQSMKGGPFTYRTLINTSNKEYRAATGANRWEPAVTTKDSGEPALPTAYQAIIKKMASLEGTIKGYQLQRSTSNDAHKESICYKCNKKGHIKPDCPENGSSGENKNWMTTPPTGSTLTLTKHNKNWKWCSKCERWMFHHADTHDAWQTRKDSKTVQASLAVVGPAPPEDSNAEAADDSDDEDDGGVNFDTPSFGWGLSNHLG
jgi:hypothetical protein